MLQRMAAGTDKPIVMDAATGEAAAKNAGTLSADTAPSLHGCNLRGTSELQDQIYFCCRWGRK